MKSALRKALPLAALCLVLSGVNAQARTEVCRYSGTSTHSGKLEVQTSATDHGQTSDLQVLLRFRASAFFQSIDYRGEEISHWQQGKLVGLDLNQRSILNGKVQKEAWHRFGIDHGTFTGVRIEAKKIEDLTTNHPAMVKYFDPSTFGLPWMSDFLKANPGRPPEINLDPAEYSSNLKSPLALAFFFVRFLPWSQQAAPIFLGGETKQKRLNVALQTPTIDQNSMATWLVPVHIGKIKTPDDQPAQFLVSRDQNLQRVELTVVHSLFSVHGVLTGQGCSFTP